MPKRSDTCETVLLALELLRRIPRNRMVSAPELHQQLRGAGIVRDLRTVQRQLEMLAEHFDIERDERSKPYGYRWKEKSRGLSLPVLSTSESLLLTLAENYLRNLLPTSVMQSMDGFFVQARTNLGPQSTAKREREWLFKIRVVNTSQPLLPPKIPPGVFEHVTEALYANHWLEVDYVNASGKRTSARVMPLGLAQQGPRLYLVCRFESFDDARSLALHRITSAQVSSQTFEYPKDFDLRRFDDEGRFGFGSGQRVSLRFRIDKGAGAHLLETPLAPDQTVKVIDEELLITATVVDSAQLQWWLNGFGDQVRTVVRRPVTESAVARNERGAPAAERKMTRGRLARS